MDPVTHGITGALLGKAFFSKRQERVAIFAATLGAVFPDIDIVCELFSRDPLGIVKYHRAITHSFVGLPVFAFLLAWLTRAALPWARQALAAIPGLGSAAAVAVDGDLRRGPREPHPAGRDDVVRDADVVSDFEPARGVGFVVHHRF